VPGRKPTQKLDGAANSVRGGVARILGPCRLMRRVDGNGGWRRGTGQRRRTGLWTRVARDTRLGYMRCPEAGRLSIPFSIRFHLPKLLQVPALRYTNGCCCGILWDARLLTRRRDAVSPAHRVLAVDAGRVTRIIAALRTTSDLGCAQKRARALALVRVGETVRRALTVAVRHVVAVARALGNRSMGAGSSIDGPGDHRAGPSARAVR